MSVGLMMWAMVGWAIKPFECPFCLFVDEGDAVFWLKLLADWDEGKAADEDEQEADDEEDWGGGVDGEDETGEADMDEGEDDELFVSLFDTSWLLSTFSWLPLSDLASFS